MAVCSVGFREFLGNSVLGMGHSSLREFDWMFFSSVTSPIGLGESAGHFNCSILGFRGAKFLYLEERR